MQWYYGFDFGTETVRMAVKGADTLRAEAQLAAFRGNGGLPFAWGDAAESYLGRETAFISVKQCQIAGIPHDAELMSAWMGRLIGFAEKRALRRRRALVAVSDQLNETVRGETLEKLVRVKLDAAGTVCADAAAALGCGLPIMEERGCFVLDMGAEHMTFSIFAGGRRIKSRTLRYGLDRADEAIIDSVRRQTGLIITRRVARALKVNAFGSGQLPPLAVFDPVKRLPRFETLSPALARESLNETISGLMELCLGVLSDIGAALSADALKYGITLCGGGSLISGLDSVLSEELGLPAAIAPYPTEAVIRGLKLIIEDPERYASLVTDTREADIRV